MIMPVDWFLALETTTGDELFSAAQNLERYGFLVPETAHDLNPYGLPIGFAVDPRKEEMGLGQQLGLTCAACHTANIQIEGKTFRVDGGPANLDFDRFYTDLASVVSHTFFDPTAFKRFAGRLGLQQDGPELAQLKEQLAMLEARLAGDAQIRNPGLASGFGRVDALTQIVNALAVTAQRMPENLRIIAAPTSYPQLWLAPHLEFVQWNPIASSPIARNGGEVLGVFGRANLHTNDDTAFQSTLLLNNLGALEEWLQTLQPPRWNPGEMGAIDEPAAERGRELYQSHCQGCHNSPPYRMTPASENHFGKQFIAIGRVNYQKVGTDPLYVESMLQRLVLTNEVTRPKNDQQAVVPALKFFLNSVGPVLTRAMDDAGLSAAQRVALSGFRFRPPTQEGEAPKIYSPPSFSDIKPPLLAGVWATGPYLHNGSVATVYEVLSPVAERRKVFFTGSRELDRERLGFQSQDAPGRFRFDTSLPGNWNTGHSYPATGLSVTQRKDLVEFLKTL
jgi:mono/diheme cytochrome c family protein